MPVVDADESSQLLYAGPDPFLVVNLDTEDTVYLGQARTVHTTDVPLPPQASAQLQGPWYASTCDSALVVQTAVLPGSAGGYSNPVGVQIALAALGLAKDSSVNAPAFGPAKDTTVSGIASNVGLGLSGGVAPGVQNIASASAVLQPITASPVTVHTFAANSRLWEVTLSAAVATSAAYAGGLTPVYVLVKLGSGTVLEVLEMGVSGPSEVDSDHGDLNLNGLPVNAGDTLVLDINNAVNPGAGSSLRASVNVLYSTP